LRKKADLTDRDFFKQPFSRKEMEELLQGSPASEMFNFRSPSFKKLNLERENLSDADLMDLMMKEPRLIRRPVVKIGKKAYFGATAGVLAQLLTVS
jgi:arsenate reductase-like glutaredoxin family protein